MHGIQLVVDVRSSPYSRHAPQSNQQTLSRTLQSVGIEYRWMGDSLGGKPGGEIPDYDKFRQRSSFRKGISTLLSLALKQPTAIMCAEGDHRQCHRHKLIAPELVDQGVLVLHIQPNGSLAEEIAEPEQLVLL